MVCARFNTVFLGQRHSLLRTLQQMVGNPNTAEDLLQDTYLRVARATAVQPVAHLEPFLFQTARNLALDHLRSRRQQARTLVDGVSDEVLHNVASTAASPEQAMQDERSLRQLLLSVARLSTRQQRIFVLDRLHDCSYREIAGHLGVSSSTVQKELKLITATCTAVADQLDI